ncbi:MAG: sulfite exporter TauE/SafE family protein [Deltaproteobacteria bacterium]|nr:sulfite exporter TauE/SafE family protein [Deltaproteobacteria bacterium]
MEPELLVLGLVALMSFGLSYVGASVGLVFGQLRLPVLVYWLGSPAVAAATSMGISSVAAMVGAARHARAGRVDLRLMATIGIPSAIAAWLSSRIAPQLDPALVKTSIGITLVITGLVMLWAALRPSAKPPPKDEESSASESREAMATARPQLVAELGMGAGLGAIAGVVGLLLGTLRLPAMMKLGVGPARAIGSNMAIGSITGLFAGAASMWDGNIDLWAFGVITPATMVGAYLGASATGRLDKATLRRLIAWSLVGVGVWMTAEPWW